MITLSKLHRIIRRMVVIPPGRTVGHVANCVRNYTAGRQRGFGIEEKLVGIIGIAMPAPNTDALLPGRPIVRSVADADGFVRREVAHYCQDLELAADVKRTVLAV